MLARLEFSGFDKQRGSVHFHAPIGFQIIIVLVVGRHRAEGAGRPAANEQCPTSVTHRGKQCLLVTLPEWWILRRLPKLAAFRRCWFHYDEHRLGRWRIDDRHRIAGLQVPFMHDEIRILKLLLHRCVGSGRLTRHEASQQQRRTAVSHQHYRLLLFVRGP